MRRHISMLITLLLAAPGPFRAAAQAPNSAWVYPSATGNLLYQLDSRGQRIADFSQCGACGGTEPLPNVAVLLPKSSDTLATNSWSTAGVTQAILTDNGTVQTVTATIPTGNGALARFARLKVASP